MTQPQNPTSTTVRKLFAFSMNQCAFPSCQTPVVDTVTHTITAEVCHICAQSPGGPRYDASQSVEQRHSLENLVLMCSVHHKIIDDPANEGTYTVEKLLAIKHSHEERAHGVQVPALSEALVAKLLASIKPAGPDVQMDFRGATLKAGGEGGMWGGGGGAGGVINIVGVTPAGFHEPIVLNGQDGQAPGGGGGGAGHAVFVGRPGDESDFENGLRISTIFIANAVEESNGLFSILGGGWAWLKIPLPQKQIRLAVQCVAETGSISPDTILRIDYEVIRPDGKVASSSHFDLTTYPTVDRVKRYAVSFFPQFDANVPGIWALILSTGGMSLTAHDFEIRSL
jgi:hypothetical protein